MAEEDALKSLQERLKQSGLTSSEPRRSRAMRTPLDAKPDTFMGASLGKDGGSTIAEEKVEDATAPKAAINLADDEDLQPSDAILAAPKRRQKKERKNAPTVTDENLFKQFANEMTTPAAKEVKPISTEEVEEKRSSALPAIPKAGIDEDEVRKLREELAMVKKKAADDKAKLADYEDLCENVIEDEKADVRALAKYIGVLMEKEDDLEAITKQKTQLQNEVVEVKKELEEVKGKEQEWKEAMEKEKKSEIENAVAAAKLENPSSPDNSDLIAKYEEKIKDLEEKLASQEEHGKEPSEDLVKLQGLLIAKDDELAQLKEELATERSKQPSEEDNEEITRLKEELNEKEATIARLQSTLEEKQSTSTPLAEMELPPELKRLEDEENKVMEAAERELMAMEKLIKDQADYIRKFEEQMKMEEEEINRKLAAMGLCLKPIEPKQEEEKEQVKEEETSTTALNANEEQDQSNQ